MEGSSRPTENKPRPTINVVTACERAEGASEREDERFPSLIENVSDVLMVLSSDGTLRCQSPSIRNVTGYEPGERQGKSIFELIHPDDKPGASAAFAQLLDRQIATLDMELRIRHKDGSWRLVEAKGKNLLDDPTVAGIVANFHEITEHGQAEGLPLEDEYMRPFIQTFSWM